MANAVLFDGVSGYAKTAASLSFPSGAGGIEVFFCMKSGSLLDSNHAVLQHRVNNSNGDIHVRNGKVRMMYSDWTGGYEIAGVTDGVPMYIGAFSDGSKLYTYYKIANTAVQRGITYGVTQTLEANNADYFEFGADGLGSRFWSNVYVYEARVWTICLTEAKIQNNASLGAVSTQSGLWGLWKFQDGGGFKISDLSGNANHAVLKNDGTNIIGAAWVNGAPDFSKIKPQLSGGGL